MMYEYLQPRLVIYGYNFAVFSVAIWISIFSSIIIIILQFYLIIRGVFESQSKLVQTVSSLSVEPIPYRIENAIMKAFPAKGKPYLLSVI